MDEEYIYFADRILDRYKYDAAGTEKTIQALSAAVNSVPEGVAVYTMLVPLRINLEKELAAYSDDVEKTFREINEALPAKAQKLDVLKKLLEHRGEYLFFRTDNSWTALGGYYAAQLYCEAAGIEMIPLSEYWEWHLESFFGANTYMEKSDIPSDYTEYVSYYLLPGATNWAEVTVRRGSNYYEKFETPTIALSRRGTDLFIGGNYSHAVLEGDKPSGKTLLIIGDSAAKFMATWLTPYYKNVYVINIARYQGEAEGYKEIWQDYDISECIILESARKFGDTPENNKLLNFVGE